MRTTLIGIGGALLCFISLFLPWAYFGGSVFNHLAITETIVKFAPYVAERAAIVAVLWYVAIATIIISGFSIALPLPKALHILRLFLFAQAACYWVLLVAVAVVGKVMEPHFLGPTICAISLITILISLLISIPKSTKPDRPPPPKNPLFRH